MLQYGEYFFLLLLFLLLKIKKETKRSDESSILVQPIWYTSSKVDIYYHERMLFFVKQSFELIDESNYYIKNNIVYFHSTIFILSKYSNRTLLFETDEIRRRIGNRLNVRRRRYVNTKNISKLKNNNRRKISFVFWVSFFHHPL